MPDSSIAAKRIIPPDEPSRDIAKATAEKREKSGNLTQSKMATLTEMDSALNMGWPLNRGKHTRKIHIETLAL